MSNLRLKKTILGVDENQLRDNDPPAAKQAYPTLSAVYYVKNNIWCIINSFLWQ